MRKAVLLFCMLFFAPATASVAALPLPKFTIMTEDWTPYQFHDGNELRGIAVDLVVELLKRSGSSQTRSDIHLLPWSRAYHTLSTVENSLLFSMTRSVERENLFRWVGPIFQNTTYLIATKRRHIKLSSPADLHKYQFATILDDASEMFLLRHGLKISQFSRNTKSLSNLRMLQAGRVDFIVSGWEAFVADAAALGFDVDDFEKIYPIDTSDVSIAFHQNTPDWIVQKFQHSLDDIKAEGVYNLILKKYQTLENSD